MRLTLLLSLCLAFASASAQPFHKDICDPSITLQIMPTKTGPGYSNGGTATYAGTTYGGFSPEPHYDCHCAPLQNFKNDSKFTWMLFQANSDYVEFQVDTLPGLGAFGFANARIALYEHQGSCFTMKPIGCATGGTSKIKKRFKVIPGVFYAVEVAGGSANDSAIFALHTTTFDSGSTCSQLKYMETFPSPVMGQYMSDETVNFHMIVQDYDTSGGKHLHGVVPEFGLGWDLGSLQYGAYTITNDGKGAWVLDTNVVNSTLKYGFFYERLPLLDNNTANNLGDHDSGPNTIWVFCFSIKTKGGTGCPDNSSLHVNFDTFHDGQSGSGVPGGCKDEKFTFSPVLNCCNAGSISNTVAVEASCRNSCDGTTSVGFFNCGGDGHNISWYNGFNDSLNASADSVSLMIDSNLCATGGGKGHILVSYNNCDNCFYLKEFEIDAGASKLNVSQLDTGCVGACDIGMSANVNGTGATFYWEDVIDSTNTHNVANPKVCQGIYNVAVTDSTGCKREGIAFAFGAPQLPADFGYPTLRKCTSEQPMAPIGAAPGYWLSIPLGFVNDSTGIFNPGASTISFSPTPIRVYHVTGVTTTCYDSAFHDVDLFQSPVAPSPVQNPVDVCLGDKAILSVTNGDNTLNVHWYADSTLNQFLSAPWDTLVVQPTGPGSHFYYALNEKRYVDINGPISCFSTASEILVNVRSGNIDAGEEILTCPNYLEYLQASGGTIYKWFPNHAMDDSVSATPRLTVGDGPEWYYVEGLDSVGCYGFDSVLVNIKSPEECERLGLYNGFSPNNDQTNDTWIINGITDYPENAVTILNRWGTDVWQESGYNNSSVVWDGTDLGGVELPNGTYYYVIDIGVGSKITGWIELTR